MTWVRRSLVLLGALVLVGGALVAVAYRRQLTSYATHRKGSPSSTTPFEALAGPPPLPHLAVAGDAGDAGDSGSPLDATAAAVAGHDHDDQRSEPIRGVTYVVTGATSGTRRTGHESFTAVSSSWHHVTDVAVYPDRIELRAADQDLRVADRATITATGAGGR